MAKKRVRDSIKQKKNKLREYEKKIQKRKKGKKIEIEKKKIAENQIRLRIGNGKMENYTRFFPQNINFPPTSSPQLLLPLRSQWIICLSLPSFLSPFTPNTRIKPPKLLSQPPLTISALAIFQISPPYAGSTYGQNGHVPRAP